MSKCIDCKCWADEEAVMLEKIRLNASFLFRLLSLEQLIGD